MTKVFLEYDQKALDDQYEQRVWVPHADEIIRRYSEESNSVRKRIGEPRVERYGPSAPETLDIYGSGKKAFVFVHGGAWRPVVAPGERGVDHLPAPALDHARVRVERYGPSAPETLDIYGSGKKAFVFVHGGAWRRQTSREQAFPAEPIIAAGAAYVALNFENLPAVTLPEMAAQVRRGIEWVHQNLSRDIVVFGHSSGGHLTACALTRLDFVRKALVVSGVYDLLPVRLSARNDYVRLDERLENEYSPIRHADRIKAAVTVSWAEHDNEEFRRQSQAFAARLGAPTLVGKGFNHFDFLETLADARSPLGRAALNMLQ